MFSIDINCAQQDAPMDKEMTVADLWEAGCTGIVELDDAGRLRAFFDDDSRQQDLQARFGGEVHPADTRDWVAFAHEFLKPMEIGEKIAVARALSDLAHMLLGSAAAQIEDITHERAQLHM